jgi:hypothetical protein
MVSVDRIRALGFEWPDLPRLAEAAVTVNGEVDLEATLSRVESSRKYYAGQMGAARDFATTWNAPIDDVTDRMDEYGEGYAANADAAERIRAIMDALARAATSPPAAATPSEERRGIWSRLRRWFADRV